jgi:hypothetical protein
MKAEEIYFVIRDQEQREGVMRFISNWELDCPAEVIIRPMCKDRSANQNRLQYKWFLEAQQQGDMKSSEVRAYCKLHLGVPILRRDSSEYREKYDRLIKPMNYEQKLELMVEPFEFPVTSAMSVKQHAEYLDAVCVHLTGKGIKLTDPSKYGLDK